LVSSVSCSFSTVSPPATIGILGGGQLGRMLAIAAAQYGLKTHVYAPQEDSPAFDVCAAYTCATYEDQTALATFAQQVDVITYEFENIPVTTLEYLLSLNDAPVYPSLKALRITQDRLLEKEFLHSLDIPLAPFVEVNSLAQLEAGLAKIGTPAILKTRRFGYDGKGQVKISRPDAAAEAFADLKNTPACLEGFVPFIREISVVAARGRDGSFMPYDAAENVHQNHILHTTHIPAKLSDAAEQHAREITQKIAEHLDYVGVLAVEFFVLEGDGSETVLVNEIAPRVHNSGHWSVEGSETSQFQQHIRAVCGWVLGSAARRGDIVFTNLIGDEALDLEKFLTQKGTYLHLYGKSEVRSGRKMGHVTQVLPFSSTRAQDA
jgi:5-(carboxyamino)imidazole ribonucleotide synthase